MPSSRFSYSADRLRELAGDPARRATLGAEGREAAVRLFSRSRLQATLIPVYEALVDERESSEVSAGSARS